MGKYYTKDQLYNEGPRYAMALLLQRLSYGEPFVTYAQISGHVERELGIEKGKIVRHHGHAPGGMMDKILKVDKQAPLINALVTGSDGIPGDGIAGYINKKYRKAKSKKWDDLSDKKKVKIVKKIRQDVRSYSRWNEIYEKLFGESAFENYPKEDFKEDAGSGRGGGESDAHKALKNWVADNPTKVGVPANFDKTVIEAPLLSGDIVDVMFSDGKSFYPVEVKSIISTDDDLRRGLYQCVKYRAVQKAQEKPVKAVVTPILVTERKLSGELKELQKRLKIKHVKVTVN